MSTAACPLHPADCNPSDPVHAQAHRAASHALKTSLYSPGADPEAQRQAWEMLDRIPHSPGPATCPGG